jgi:hypothetical protein
LSTLTLAPLLWPQSFTGSIVGTVIDSSGGAIPNVAVAAVNQDTGERRSTQTTGAGQFLIAALAPGNYTLEVSFAGFKTHRRANLRVEVQLDLRVDVVLEPGTVDEVVNVTAETQLLEAENASVGTVVENKSIVSMPLYGRNTIALVALTSGVQPASVNTFGNQPVLSNPYDHGAFSVNTGLDMGSEFLIDGIPNNAFLWDAPVFVPSIDAVQEFKVEGSGLSAEFGHSGGGIINLTMKSGTNRFHGSLFEFLQNDKLNANNFFNNASRLAKPSMKQNGFGGSAGGPVKLPHYDGTSRTFFFFSYDGFRDRRPSSTLTTVPTIAERQGNFAGVLNTAGQPVTIYDPDAVHVNSGEGSGHLRDPFPGNQIPLGRFDPVAAKVVNTYAAPNLSGSGPALINNFVGAVNRADVQDQVNAKIDHIFNTQHHLFGRFTFHRQLPGTADLFHTVRGASGGGVIDIWTRSVALDHTYTIGPTLLAEFRGGFSRQHWINAPLSIGMDLTTLGFPAAFARAVQVPMMPTLSVAGFYSLGEGGTNSYIHRGDNQHNAQASLTKALTRQSLKTGFEFRSYLFNDVRAPFATGLYSFTSAFTQSRANATAGNAMASFLLGGTAAGTIGYFPPVALNQKYFATYLQDDFRISSRLTLNLGVRWDMDTPKTERFNRLSTFDPYIASPLAQVTGLPVVGGIRFMGVDGNSRGQWQTVWHDVAPRFGFAYRITPRFITRGGFGIMFSQTEGQGGAINNGNDGFAVTQPMITTLDGGITIANRIGNPYPDGLVQPLGSKSGLMAQLGLSLQPWSNHLTNPHTEHFNFGFEHELPGGLLVDSTWVGSHSVGLPVVIPENQLSPVYLPLGNQLLAQVKNPFYGIIKSGAVSQPSVPQNLLLRPFPQFSDISYYAPIAQATYNSMQMRVERRFRNDFGFLLSYTLSKALTDAGNTGIFGFQTPQIQNVYNLAGEKAISPIDVTHRAVVSYEYEFPFGRGKRWATSAPRVLNSILSGWQINGVTTIQSGLPLQLTNSNNQTNTFDIASRPNIAPGATAELAHPTVAQWFNTSVFSQPAPFTFGNVSRTIPNVRVPGIVQFDISLFKNTVVRENARLQFRLESFNSFNHANFGPPGQVFGTAQLGVISTANPARTVQVGAKLLF